MKMPEEIKKGLECCHRRNSCRRKCPYDGPSHDIDKCTTQLAGDALTYIQQLEEREKNLYAAIHAVMHSIDKWLDVEPYDFDKDDGTVAATRASNARELALNAIEKAERERDAAVNELNEERSCLNCKHREKRPNKQPCRSCDVAARHKYEWRGVCRENTKEE